MVLVHPERIPPPPYAPSVAAICPPVLPMSPCSVSCLPGIPFHPLGTAPLPLGCAVQPTIQLLVLPRVLSPSVKLQAPPPIYLLVASGTPIFPPVCPRAFCFPPSVPQSPLLTHRSQDCSVSSFGASPLCPLVPSVSPPVQPGAFHSSQDSHKKGISCFPLSKE